jgi:hypothetical protein
MRYLALLLLLGCSEPQPEAPAPPYWTELPNPNRFCNVYYHDDPTWGRVYVGYGCTVVK